jgi:hypothetical protein
MFKGHGGNWRGQGTYFANLENTIYANHIEKDDPIFCHFFIDTKIGIGKLRNEKDIENIKIEFEFITKGREDSEVEIVEIRPNDQVKEIGIVQGKESRKFKYGGNLGANLSIDAVFADLKGKAGIEGEKSSEEVKTYTYPNSIQISKGSGVGNHVNWEFKQGKGANQKGEYEMNILFRIRKPLNEIPEKEGTYVVRPKVKVNNVEIKDEKDKKELKDVPIYIIK